MLDAEEWVLDNGARIFYKYTDGDKGMFNMLAGSPGGRSVIKAAGFALCRCLVCLVFARRIV